MAQIKRLLAFTFLLILFSGIYVLITPNQVALPESGFRHELGEALGSAVTWLFVIIYGRTLLKIVLRQGPLLDRLLPDGIQRHSLPIASMVLKYLNKTHIYVGAAVIVLLFGHAWLEGLRQANLLMQIILALSLWQFGFGLFLLNHFNAVFVKKMKRYGYLVHSQLYTGVAIGVFAIFGHLLVAD